MISMASQLQEQRDSMSKISHEANEGDLRQSDNQGSDVAAAVQPAAPEESSYMSSANRDSSISLANSSIIKSLLAELATVKASVTSKVEAVQSESKQVVEGGAGAGSAAPTVIFVPHYQVCKHAKVNI